MLQTDQFFFFVIPKPCFDSNMVFLNVYAYERMACLHISFPLEILTSVGDLVIFASCSIQFFPSSLNSLTRGTKVSLYSCSYVCLGFVLTPYTVYSFELP